MMALGTESLGLEDARATTEQLVKTSGWSNSLLKGMLGEGVLTQDRVPSADGAARTDQIFFAYQRFGDHLRAIAFCEHNEDDIDRIAAACEGLAPGAGFVPQPGLVEALSILIPEQHGREFHELVSFGDSYTVRNAYLESLVWRAPDAFPHPLSFDYVNSLIGAHMGDEVLNTILSVACVPGHPLNADRLHGTLCRLTMPDRDGWWSIYLHRNFDEGTPIARLVDWAWSDDTSYCADDAALLCGTALAWFFTSSNRFLRDRATKALVSLLRGRPLS